MQKKLSFFILLLIAAAIVAFFVLQPHLYLILRTPDGGILVSQGVGPGDEVSLTFIHSVEKVLVVDNFIIQDNGSLMLKNTTFGSSGAGLPTDSSYNLSHTANSDFLIEGINKSFGSIDLTTGNITKNHLIVSGKDYPIYTMAEEGEPLILAVERKSAIETFIYPNRY